MAVLRLAAGLKNAMVDRVKDLLDAGAGNGSIKIYTAPQPASANDPPGAAALLATLTLAKPSAPWAVNGVLTLNPIPQANASGSGAAAWVRLADSAGNTVADGDVTASGGGGTLELNTVNLVAGAPVLITAFTFTMPSGA